MDERHKWLTLQAVPGLGPMSIAKLWRQNLLQHFLTPNVEELTRLGVNQKQQSALLNPDLQYLEQVDQWLCRSQGRVITLVDSEYPELLKQIADPPPLIFCVGQEELLSAPQLAIVGSRHASPSGRANARQIAKQVTKSGYQVTSGLALGIDACAHQGALDVGATIAVLGAGLDNIYPKRHQALAQQIIDNHGLLISEVPPWTAPVGYLFPRRNRIISGLSEGVLVVEASMRSGSLITAKLALEQGREVYAMPGAVGNPQSQGCHQLIKDGAGLVEGIDDIFWPGDLNPEKSPSYSTSDTSKLALPNSVLLDNVKDNATSVDELVQETGLAVEVVLSELLELEMQGSVASVPGGYIRLRGS
ncbi:DNA-processing protein DprA [Echinimonas agarilytica]|uniref:DNA-processing protein DprA n=1 Tax=Echinimonas agarilytica TaxID=1215918 RepID=A0AA41W377_9GAMM|nr:DNA-processing protein DprA [Echinimonas agarilytica]MCM2678061.1 DNA-processing protein DprA [Echinimonas agarilytica]